METATLVRVMPGLSTARAAQLIAGFNAAMIQAGCTTVDRAAMWCAQLGEESVSLKYTTEIASGQEYEGRTDLGNTHTGDGPRFKGRGFIQVTGRSNYGKLSQWAYAHHLVPTSTYFVDNPTVVANDYWASMSAVWYWTVARNLNYYADRKDIKGATLAVNGAYNGLQDRTNRWNAALKLGNALLPGDGLDMFTATQIAQIVKSNAGAAPCENEVVGQVQTETAVLTYTHGGVSILMAQQDAFFAALAAGDSLSQAAVAGQKAKAEMIAQIVANGHKK